MTEYHIKTATGKEGPFSVEELRKKGISSETIVSQNGAAWKPAAKIEALRSILPEIGTPLYLNKKTGINPSGSADGVKTPKASSKFSALQLTAFVLLIVNGMVYYYKQAEEPAKEKKAAVAVLTPVKTIAVQASVKPAEKVQIQKVDTAGKVRNNWSNFIKASPNNFKHYTKLGGIHKLKAIVRNDSGFPLDTVKLAVNYIRRGATFKTEFVTLVNVPKHGELAVDAPNSKSGTEVTLDIREISSQKMKFYYSAELPAEGKEDPYFRL